MAITFTGNSYITIDNAWTNLTVTTICFWVYINTLNASTNRLVGTDDSWEIRVTNDWWGTWYFSNELFSSNVTQPPPAHSTTVVTINTWYHVTATVDATKFGQIFINGVLEGSGTSADSPTGTIFSIGNRDSVANQSCNGVMEDIRVYTRVLSANEITTIYACRGSDHIFYGLQNRWLLNEGAEGVAITGTGVVKDMIGARTGSPVNSPTYTGSRLKKTRHSMYR